MDAFCVVACDSVAGLCDTTIIIVSITPEAPCPTTDTLHLSLPVNTAGQLCVELDDCLDADNTSYGTCDGILSGISDYGEWFVNPNDGCLNYVAGDLSGDEVDAFCVVACDSVAGLCDTTIIIVSITPEAPCPTTDTLHLSLPVNTAGQLCVELDDCLDADNTSYGTCDGILSGISDYGEWFVNPNDGCLNYVAGDLSGDEVDAFCVVACDSVAGLCDTTIIIVSITPEAPCPNLDTILLEVPVLSTGEACVEIESCMDLTACSFTTCDGTLEGTTDYGAWNLDDSTGCLIYNAGDQFGTAVDTFCVIACDSISGVCDTTTIIVSVLPDCPDIIADTSVVLHVDDCLDEADLCLDIPQSEAPNYTVTVAGDTLPFVVGCAFDSLFGYNYSLIPGQGNVGPYSLDEWTINGAAFTGSFNTLQELVDLMNGFDPAGVWTIDPAIFNIVGGDKVSNYGPLRITQVNTQIVANIQLNDLFIPSGTAVQLPVGEHTVIITENATGCQDSVKVTVNCDPCPTFYSGPANYELTDCDDLADLCLDIDPLDLADFSFTLNGDDYMGGTVGCAFDTALAYNYLAVITANPNGPYTIEAWFVGSEVFSGVVADIAALVDSMNAWDPTGNWELDVNTSMIKGGDPGLNYGLLIISQNGVPLAGLQPNLQPLPTGIALQLPQGEHELVITQSSTGCSETHNITVSCEEIPSVDVTLALCASDTLCLDPLAIDTIASITNLCPDAADGQVSLQLAGGNCVALTGDAVGVDTFCLEVCDAAGTCEQIEIIVTVNEPVVTTETLVIDLAICAVDTICLDSELSCAIDTIFNACPAASGFASDIVPISGTNCVEIVAETNGVDTACIVICDELGYCDTTILIVQVSESTTVDTVTYELEVGESGSHCIDLTELCTAPTSIEDICAGSESVVDWTLVDSTFCVEFDALAEGSDTACFVVCGNILCDTTIVIVTVLPDTTMNEEPPFAVNDTVMTKENRMVNINVINNDEGRDTIVTGTVLNGPANGTLTGDVLDGFLYMPNAGFCDAIDSFTYMITNEHGLSDTATVIIEVECRKLIIYSGFSPNGDNVNDQFTITGIEDYPENEVIIFNRWGNEVFYRRGYNNDNAWDGRWEGQELPDGTYFYIVRDGEGETYSGYIQIHR